MSDDSPFLKEIPDWILDVYRDNNTEQCPWWEDTYDRVVEEAELLGYTLETDSIWFQGFWGGSDGATFSGSINPLKYMATKGISHNFPLIHQMVDMGGILSAQITRPNGVHSLTAEAEITDYDLISYLREDDTVVSDGMDEFLDTLLEQEIQQLQDILEEETQDMIGDLYTRLREEYEYLTSDAVVMEMLLDYPEMVVGEMRDAGWDEEEIAEYVKPEFLTP